MTNPQAVSILPAGTRVSVTHRASCLVLEIDPLLLQQSATPSGSGDLELPVKLTIHDLNIELLMTAMEADLVAASPTGPLYGKSLGNTLGTYLVQRFAVFTPKLEGYKGGLPKPHVNRVREYIEQDLDSSISLTALAEVAGVSLYHFAKTSAGRRCSELPNASRLSSRWCSPTCSTTTSRRSHRIVPRHQQPYWLGNAARFYNSRHSSYMRQMQFGLRLNL
jgi:hypothetical protein